MTRRNTAAVVASVALASLGATTTLALARATEPNYRAQLAGFWNAWFSRREIADARKLAESLGNEECRLELERLYKIRDARLEAWRLSQ